MADNADTALSMFLGFSLGMLTAFFLVSLA